MLQGKDIVESQALSRTLQRRHMQMIALGGVIGAGLFVGSGVVVQATGPAAVISFALTGTLVVVEPLEQAHKGAARLGEKCVVIAGDEERCSYERSPAQRANRKR